MDSEISGKLMVRDYLRFALYQLKYLIIFQMILSIFIVLLFRSANNLFGLSPFSYVLFPILNIILIFLMNFFRERRNYQSLDKRFHDKVAKINEKGIQYGTKENPGIFQWSDIQKGVFLKEMTMLYISTEEAILIPNHFFSSLAEQREWVAFIKNHLTD